MSNHRLSPNSTKETLVTNSELAHLIDGLNAGRLSRRGFFSGAAKLGLSAGLAGAIFGAARNGAGASPAAGPARVSARYQGGGATIVVAFPQTTTQLDPGLAGNDGYGDIIPINENLYEGLTRYKNGTAEVEPALAESWTTSADGLTWVFKIRSGVTFHDGTKLDAKAVETVFNRQLDKTSPLYSDQFGYAPIVFAEFKTVKATGDLELTITLNRPITLVPANLAVFAAGIPSPTALTTYKNDYSSHAAGTGPFTLDHWTTDVELVYTAFDNYWGGKPKLDKVIWQTIADDTTRLASLQQGQIDVANQLDLKDVDTVKNDANLQLIAGDFWNVQFLGLNASVAPFDKLEVRQAVSYAINKQNIADAVFYGQYTLGGGPIAPGLLAYDASLANTYPHDPDKAKALLAQAGVSNVSFDLYNRTNSTWPLIGQLIQADLADVGITANLKALEDAQFFPQLATGKSPAFLNDWTWDNGDPDNILNALYVGDRAKSRLGYANQQVADWITGAETEKDQNKRAQIYAQVQQQLLKDAVSVFLGYPKRALAADKKVQGLVLSPIGNIVLRDVSVS
jgi:peptide/nickel transport system substrate-binding protein